MKRVGGLALLIIAVACSSPAPDAPAGGTWVGTITTEGNVTTVVNESGSVWGGTARLVEEASIGVEAGPAEYMFGEIASVYADEEAIYVIDGQLPQVRVYDHDGNHLHDLGGPGQGPGEYTRPRLVTGAPGGRILVADGGNRRINVYDQDGNALDETYPLGRGALVHPFVFLDAAGVLWTSYGDLDEETLEYRYSVRGHGPDGLLADVREIPEVEENPIQIAHGGRKRNVPYSPTNVWTLTPIGTLIVGASDRYRFELHAPDGSLTIVQKYWGPVPVGEREVDYRRRFMTLVDRAPPDWDGAEIPDHKPAFQTLRGTATGEIWVYRPGAGVLAPGCNDVPRTIDEAFGARPCWRDSQIVDAFDPRGRFLGEVEIPDEVQDPIIWTTPHVSGDRVVAVATDEAGTIMVKRYRLVLPGER